MPKIVWTSVAIGVALTLLAQFLLSRRKVSA